MDIEETAAQLVIKQETVKTRLHRARRMLRRTIEQRLSAGFSDLFPFGGERCAGMADRVLERLGASPDGRPLRS
jgi:RNA polymerase sigma-70 factor (ECF subfamily)